MLVENLTRNSLLTLVEQALACYSTSVDSKQINTCENK